MTPHEERLVLELHSKWGNRWSRIARKLPGRTDNEIKNYWRTHMRKQAQERKKGGSAAASATPSSSTTSTSTTTASSSTSTSTSSSNFSKCFSSVSIGNSPPTVESVPPAEKDGDRSFYDTGGINKAVATVPMASPVDEIWKDMDFFGDDPIKPVYNDYGYGGTGAVASSMASPAWEYFQVPLWTMDEEVEDISKKFPPISDQFFPMNSALARW